MKVVFKSMVGMLSGLLLISQIGCSNLQPPSEKSAMDEGLLWLTMFMLFYEPASDNPLMNYTLEACDGSSSAYPSGNFYKISGYGYQGGGFSSNLQNLENLALNDDSLIRAHFGTQVRQSVGTEASAWNALELRSFMNTFLSSNAWNSSTYCGNLDYNELGRLSRHRAQINATYHLRKVRSLVDIEYAKVSGLPALESINIAVLPDWLLRLRSLTEPFSNIHFLTDNAFYSSRREALNWNGNFIILAPFTEEFYPMVGNIHFYENEGVVNHEYGHHVLSVIMGEKGPLNFKFQGIVRDRHKGSFTGRNRPPGETRSNIRVEENKAVLFGAQSSFLQNRAFGAIHEGFADLLSFYSLNRNSLPFKDSLGRGRQPDVSVFDSGVAKNITLNCRENFEQTSFSGATTSCEARELRPFGDVNGNFDLDTHTYGAVLAAVVYEAYQAFKDNANFTDGTAPLSNGGELEHLLRGARDYAASLPGSNGEYYLGEFFYYMIQFAVNDGLNGTGKSAVCTILNNRLSYLTVVTFSNTVPNEKNRSAVATLLTALGGCP